MDRTLTIAGIDRTTNLMARTLTITDRIPGRSTCAFELHDLAEVITLQEGMSVLVEAGGSTIFAGEIQRVKGHKEKQVLEYQVSCIDYNGILDRVLIAEAYDAMSAGDIVRDIHAEKLAAEGITLGVVEDGPVGSRSVFDWVPASEAFNELEKVTGISWNVDYDKVLDYTFPGAHAAPFNLDSTSVYHNLNLERARDNYRNVQVFRPGMLETALQTETPTPVPDGSSRTFVTRFPVARRPRIIVNSVEISSSDIGVNGLNAPGTKRWYFSRQSNQISQDDTEPLLIAGDTLQFIYTGLYRRIFVVEKADEITARAAIEGGSGRWEHYDDKASVDDVDTANQYTLGLLRKFGQISNVLTYNTYEHGLRAGMVQQVDIPDRGILGEYLIESVTGRAVGPGAMLYNVKAIDGEVVGGWMDFFRSLMIRGRDFAIRDDEFVSLIFGLADEDMQDIADVVDTYDANPPFQFDGTTPFAGNIEWGRWQWFSYTETEAFLTPDFPVSVVTW